MKIKMPTFYELEDDDFDNDGFMMHMKVYHPYFNGVILMDGDTETYFMYGYLTTTGYSDDAIVMTDDIVIDETKDGRPRKSSIRKAYKTVKKQLRERYREWVKKNILD